MESVGRNRFSKFVATAECKSLSAWRAWVEILLPPVLCTEPTVALRMESVGRNGFVIDNFCGVNVALRMESVGRNQQLLQLPSLLLLSLSAWRAWVEIYINALHRGQPWSLSAWRAWVEIFPALFCILHCLVALRMESVGRNATAAIGTAAIATSLSAWRAWVEIRKII